jgi:CrcB protein
VADFLIVAFGAGLGGAMRHAVNILAARLLGTGFPYGTLTVNVAGSFAMGLLTPLLLAHPAVSPGWRLLLAPGVLGGFTTFSTFALDTGVMLARKARALAFGYGLVSVAASIGALALGLWLGGR